MADLKLSRNSTPAVTPGGRIARVKEIATAEKINPSYVSRVLRLTLLAPTTVEAILGGRANAAPTLAEAMKVFPVEWPQQNRYVSQTNL